MALWQWLSRREHERWMSNHAGAWLDLMPTHVSCQAPARSFQLALAMRLGAELVELADVPLAERMCGCGAVHDVFGRHPSSCKAGNRHGLWTVRHDALQRSLEWVARSVGRSVRVVGRVRWFSAAALRAAGRTWDQPLFADLVLPHYRAPGRHLYIDAAVTTPQALGPIGANPSACDRGGVAAELRVGKKHAKYRQAVLAMGGSFRAAVLDRFGACSDDLVGLVRELCGDGLIDAESDEWSFTAASRRVFYMQRVVFAGVMADAAMVETALDLDVACTHPDALRGAGGAGAGAA